MWTINIQQFSFFILLTIIKAATVFNIWHSVFPSYRGETILMKNALSYNMVVYRSDKHMLLTDLDVENKSKIYIAFFTNLQCYTLAALGKIDDCDCEINPVMFTIRLLS